MDLNAKGIEGWWVNNVVEKWPTRKKKQSSELNKALKVRGPGSSRSFFCFFLIGVLWRNRSWVQEGSANEVAVTEFNLLHFIHYSYKFGISPFIVQLNFNY